MLFSISEKYPRSLSAWLKSDEKLLCNAISNGLSVLEIAEDLKREHISILNHLNDMGLLTFDTHTEKWVEVMGLALCGIPLNITINWCNDTDDQLRFDDIESMAMAGHLINEFELARSLHIFVPNICAIEDLSWLAEQPIVVQANYPKACAELTDAFEIITPTTIKQQIIGTQAPALVPQLSGAGVSAWGVNTNTKNHTTSKRAKHYRLKFGSSSKSAYFSTKKINRKKMPSDSVWD